MAWFQQASKACRSVIELVITGEACRVATTCRGFRASAAGARFLPAVSAGLVSRRMNRGSSQRNRLIVNIETTCFELTAAGESDASLARHQWQIATCTTRQ